MQLQDPQLLTEVIQPVLECLEEHQPGAQQVLMRMARQASHFDPLYRSGGNSAGIGLYQITSTQHRRVWDDFVAQDADLSSRLRGLASQRRFLQNPDDELRFNLLYATAIAWLLYKMQTMESTLFTPPSRQNEPALAVL